MMALRPEMAISRHPCKILTAPIAIEILFSLPWTNPMVTSGEWQNQSLLSADEEPSNRRGEGDVSK
jgi:hypothetical protein